VPNFCDPERIVCSLFDVNWAWATEAIIMARARAQMKIPQNTLGLEEQEKLCFLCIVVMMHS
jgi:hypothetical protein